MSAILPGPFGYAERWDEKSDTYSVLVIEGSINAAIVIDKDSVIVRPEVAEAHRPEPAQLVGATDELEDREPDKEKEPSGSADEDRKPTRFTGTVMISPERPAKDIHQIIESIVEQLTTLQGSEVELKLEINAEVPAGLKRTKVRTLIENAITLGFIEKSVR